MNAVDAKFAEWMQRVYGRPLDGEQAAQIEMAFYAGVVACRTVLRTSGGLTIESAPDECKGAIDEIARSVLSHVERINLRDAAAVKH